MVLDTHQILVKCLVDCSILVGQLFIEFKAKNTASRGRKALTGICSLKDTISSGIGVAQSCELCPQASAVCGLVSLQHDHSRALGRFSLQIELTGPGTFFSELVEVVNMYPGYMCM